METSGVMPVMQCLRARRHGVEVHNCDGALKDGNYQTGMSAFGKCMLWDV